VPLSPYRKGFSPSEFACPCGRPATVRTWESDLYLCFSHGREWLASQEKEIAKAAVVEKNDEALRGAVEAFVRRIARKPSFTERVRGAVSALFGKEIG
jgi:hypothetical protein